MVNRLVKVVTICSPLLFFGCKSNVSNSPKVNGGSGNLLSSLTIGDYEEDFKDFHDLEAELYCDKSKPVTTKALVRGSSLEMVYNRSSLVLNDMCYSKIFLLESSKNDMSNLVKKYNFEDSDRGRRPLFISNKGQIIESGIKLKFYRVYESIADKNPKDQVGVKVQLQSVSPVQVENYLILQCGDGEMMNVKRVTLSSTKLTTVEGNVPRDYIKKGACHFEIFSEGQVARYVSDEVTFAKSNDVFVFNNSEVVTLVKKENSSGSGGVVVDAEFAECKGKVAADGRGCITENTPDKGLNEEQKKHYKDLKTIIEGQKHSLNSAIFGNYKLETMDFSKKFTINFGDNIEIIKDPAFKEFEGDFNTNKVFGSWSIKDVTYKVIHRGLGKARYNINISNNENADVCIRFYFNIKESKAPNITKPTSTYHVLITDDCLTLSNGTFSLAGRLKILDKSE